MIGQSAATRTNPTNPTNRKRIESKNGPITGFDSQSDGPGGKITRRMREKERIEIRKKKRDAEASSDVRDQ